VVRALDAVGRRARVRLTKRIPAGAGLGGGSSDAAAVLRWAAALDPELALKLGADVPFCVAGGRALVSGVGDELEGQPYERFTVVLVTPALAVSTPEVYRAWDSLGGPVGETGNDLELAAVVVEPRLAWWRDLIEDVAGERPRLAGSGSTWFVERSPEAAELLVADLKDAVLSERRRALLVAATSTPGP
jgi:4-diphosphocytidyl-2-C-methyl-D-erythritol kinase